MPDSPSVSTLLRGTAAGGELRVVATDATALVREAHERHGLSHTATAALGRSLVAALLLSQVLGKHKESTRKAGWRCASRATARWVTWWPRGPTTARCAATCATPAPNCRRAWATVSWTSAG